MNSSLSPCKAVLQGGLSPAALGELMPMFLWLDRHGVICAAGPTLMKILGPGPVVGTAFETHFHLRRARARRHEQDEAHPGGRKLILMLLSHPEIGLRGTAVEVGPEGAEGMLLNLTFGIHLADAVREFGLTEGDFATSDLAIELLYLREAKAAVMDELRALNGRLEEARRAAERQALTDPLTGLANRRAFDAALQRAVRAQAHGGAPFALVLVDLDHFKQVNDHMGHAAGDQVLNWASAILAQEVRRGDVVARAGGDEFVLLLRGAIDRARLQTLGRRMIARLEEPCLVDGTPCRISASIGIAFSRDYPEPEVDRMLADADAALYEAKRSGRGRCSIHAAGAVA